MNILPEPTSTNVLTGDYGVVVLLQLAAAIVICAVVYGIVKVCLRITNYDHPPQCDASLHSWAMKPTDDRHLTRWAGRGATDDEEG